MVEPRLLFINGSLHGNTGNTFALVNKMLNKISGDVNILELSQINKYNISNIIDIMSNHDGFIFGTGTYWQSWSSYMQHFFEMMVDYEGHKMWMGKPACCVVTMHSVGGMDVLSRLQSNLGMFGMVIPPMCNIVHSYVNTLARKYSNDGDIWDERYLDVILHNLYAAINGTAYKSWNVETEDNHVIWCK